MYLNNYSFSDVNIGLKQLSEACQHQKFEGLFSLPMIQRFFNNGTDIAAFCDKIDVTELMKGLDDLLETMEKSSGNKLDDLKEILLRLHLTLKSGWSVLGSIMSLPRLPERVIRILNDIANNRNLFKLIDGTGFWDVVMDMGIGHIICDIREAFECK